MPDLNRRQSTRQAGDRGEVLVLQYLQEKDYALVEHNYRTRHGEINLVVRGEKSLVFVEVKLRRGTGFGDPLEAVMPKKQDKIRMMAEQYLAEKGEDFSAGFDEVHFDVVGILLLTGAGKPEVQQIEDAF